MKLIKIILPVVTVCTFLYSEQSVYSDSDFIDTDSVVKKNSREIFILKQKINGLKEKIEGLKTIIRGQTQQINLLKNKNSNELEKIVQDLSNRISELEKNKYKAVATTYKKYEPPVVKDALAEGSNSESIKNNIKVSSDNLKKKSDKELYKEAILNYNRKRYTKAKSIFNKLIQNGYNKDSSSFYLGEIAYYRGKYTEAILKYKSSANLNEKATYMDRLLLHAGIALIKIGQKEKAKSFFKTIIDNYPNSASSKEAKKYLR